MHILYRIGAVAFISLLSCQEKPLHLTKITGKEWVIDSLIAEDSAVAAFIKPYQQHVNKEMGNVLAYTPKSLSKTEGTLNTAIGNLMADAVYEYTQPLFKARTGKNIDFVMLNYGGIRSVIPKGDVTVRTAYEVMPFENYMLVIELTAEKVQELIRYLVKGARAHPLSSQVQITLKPNGELHEVRIHKKPIDPRQTYFVATSNYMANGGDHADFFSNPVSSTEINYLIRNILIDYFKKVDTLTATADNRFIKLPAL